MTGEPLTGDPGASEPAGDRSPLQLAADLLVYAPMGFAAVARDLLPTLAERGRSEVASQVSLARIVGQLVVRQGQDELGRAVGGARQQVGALVEQFVRTFTGDTPDDEAAPMATDLAPEPEAGTRNAPDGEGKGSDERPMAAALPIPDYDSLAASQVIPRLAALAPDELEAVRRYEAATRARRTILGRIAQLQG